MIEDEFDYVVVGGGTAGNVVAARLSEDPSVTVCVLEAGPSDVGDDDVLKLERWMGLLESGYDWDYPVEPQTSGNSFMRHARAKVLGGCSSHNSCIAFWAPAEDLDDWAAAGCTGWSAADLFPLYQRLETNDAPGDHHGRSGPVKLRTIKSEDPCGNALLEACAQAGIPTTPFNTGTTVVRGANWFQINSDENNIRQSSSVAYLHPIMGRRPNLEVRTGVRAKKLVLDGRRCVGAEYLDPDLIHTRTVRARREVIVSCGAIDTPKLLMLSGIGPAEQLREVGVDVVVHSAGVGENLQDHPEGVIMWEAAQPMPGFSPAQYRQDRDRSARDDDRPRWSLSEVVRRLRGSRQGQMLDARESSYGGRPVFVIIWEYPGGRVANIYVDQRTGAVIGED